MENQIKILYIDDDETFIDLIKVILSEFKLDIAHNGLEGVSAISNEEYDLVITNIQMPILNGIDATKMIRKISPEIPIIACTAHDLDEIDIFDDVIKKPIIKKTMIDKIEKVISGNSSVGRV